MTEATALLRLQQIDLELIRLRRSAESLPQRAKVVAARAASKKISAELTKIVGQRKDLEIELSDLDEAKALYAGHVTDVQKRAETEEGFRATRDFETSLSHLAKRLEKTEFDAERVMRDLEQVERAEARAREVQGRLTEEEHSLTESYQNATASITEQVKALLAERETVTGDISPKVMVDYERASRRFSGIAVETLEGNRPSACRVALQPSSFADLRRAGEITTCPYCKRILVVSQGAQA